MSFSPSPEDRTTNLSIILANQTSPSPSPSTSTSTPWPPLPSSEPLPHIDYPLLHALITLARTHNHLDARALQRHDDLASARQKYYFAHTNFQHHFRILADTYAYVQSLDREFEQLRGLCEQMRGEEEGVVGLVTGWLVDVERRQRRGNGRLEGLVGDVEEKRKVREAACLHFSEVKTAFLKDEMPVLVELAKQLKAVHEKGMDKERTDASTSTTTTTAASNPSTTPPTAHALHSLEHTPKPVDYAKPETLDGDDTTVALDDEKGKAGASTAFPADRPEEGSDELYLPNFEQSEDEDGEAVMLIE